jgi:hypothetical protein
MSSFIQLETGPDIHVVSHRSISAHPGFHIMNFAAADGAK